MMNAAATEHQISEAERALGINLPADYRERLLRQDGGAGFFGEEYLVLHSVEGMIEHNQAANPMEDMPGMVFIGSNGGGENVALDLRQDPPTVVLINAMAIHWGEASFQASSFTEFMAQRDRGEDFVFTMDTL